jgi:hypothetical protein
MTKSEEILAMKSLSRLFLRAMLFIAVPSISLTLAADSKNLIQNPDFEKSGERASVASNFLIKGDASRTFVGASYELSSMGVALDSSRDLDGDGSREAWVSQDVAIESTLPGRWFRFQIRGLPEDGFAVGGDHLLMKVDFFGDRGKRPLDGVTRKIYPQIEQERRDLTTNGVRHLGGAATWKTYGFEFRLPFPDIDQLKVSVGFRDGQGKGRNASFFVDDLSLVAITTPADAPDGPAIRPARPSSVDPSKLVAIGGRWFYAPKDGEKVEAGGRGLTITEKNADRLLYNDGEGRYLNPFAENMAAWLKRGYLDLSGKLVNEDQLKTDNVTITFDRTSLIVHARNLPNHPTSKFPSVAGSGDRNPNYIQEQDSTYYLPLNPEHNPTAQAMVDSKNSNRALPMGPIGFAVNGVVFFNPFDMGNVDATDLMDRCCGHPNQTNQYHYHKYPVCVKSPFADEGREHSPLIGWAFDGFAIYGPYEGLEVMAKDSKENPINEFNGHSDPERGWHYHVTPGKFPYILGGYWGKVDPRNRRGPGGGGPGGPGGPGGRAGGGPGGLGGPGGGPPPLPLLMALDTNHDGEVSSDEIAGSAAALKTLDRNGDGKLTEDELRPPPPGGPQPF